MIAYPPVPRMRVGLRAVLLMALLVLSAAIGAYAPVCARASSLLHSFNVTYTNADGSPDTQAGSHPFAMTTSFEVPGHPTAAGGYAIDEAVKDVIIKQIVGLGGQPNATPRCSSVSFLTRTTNSGGEFVSDCPDATAVGTITFVLTNETVQPVPLFASIYNLAAPPGICVRAWVLGRWRPMQILDWRRRMARVQDHRGFARHFAGHRSGRRVAHVVGRPRRSGSRSRARQLPGYRLMVVLATVVPPAFPRFRSSRCRVRATVLLASGYTVDYWSHPGDLWTAANPTSRRADWFMGEELTRRRRRGPPPTPQGVTGCPNSGSARRSRRSRRRCPRRTRQALISAWTSTTKGWRTLRSCAIGHRQGRR